MDLVEIAFLKGLTPNKFVALSSKAKPITFDINGHTVEISEWSQLQLAKNTLVKLILVVRFYQTIAPIWKDHDRVHKTKSLKDKYYTAGAIIRCLTECCGNDLIRFHDGQSENLFRHSNYCCQCSVGRRKLDLYLKSVEENYLELCNLLVSYRPEVFSSVWFQTCLKMACFDA
jgi:hypothetical protein